MPNRWIEFVKSWAQKKGMSYGCALSDPQLKIDYRKSYPTKQQEKANESRETEMMGMEDEDADEIIKVKKVKKTKTKGLALQGSKKKEAKEREMMGMEDRDAPEKVIAKKTDVWTETAEAKQKRKEREKENIMEALWRSLTDLIYDKNMSLSEALFKMFPDIQLNAQKLHSLPQLIKNGEHTGRLLLYNQSLVKKVDWFMEYVNKILRGNFDGINRNIYEKTYEFLNVPIGVREERMFEMGEEDTRGRSGREYLKSPFNKFYIGEEVLHYDKRGNIVKQTNTGVRFQPKNKEEKSYIIRYASSLEKLIS